MIRKSVSRVSRFFISDRFCELFKSAISGISASRDKTQTVIICLYYDIFKRSFEFPKNAPMPDFIFLIPRNVWRLDAPRSRSARTTRFPSSARAIARLVERRDFPTPLCRSRQAGSSFIIPHLFALHWQHDCLFEFRQSSFRNSALKPGFVITYLIW